MSAVTRGYITKSIKPMTPSPGKKETERRSIVGEGAAFT